MKFSLNLHLHTQDKNKCAIDFHVKGRSDWRMFDSQESLRLVLKDALKEETYGVQTRMLNILDYAPPDGTVTGSVTIEGLPEDQHGTERGNRKFTQKVRFAEEGQDFETFKDAVGVACDRLLKSVTAKEEWDELIPAKGPQRSLDDYYDAAGKALDEKDVTEDGLSGYVTTEEQGEGQAETESILGTVEADVAAELEPEDDREPEEADEDDLDYSAGNEDDFVHWCEELTVDEVDELSQAELKEAVDFFQLKSDKRSVAQMADDVREHLILETAQNEDAGE